MFLLRLGLIAKIVGAALGLFTIVAFIALILGLTPIYRGRPGTTTTTQAYSGN